MLPGTAGPAVGNDVLDMANVAVLVFRNVKMFNQAPSGPRVFPGNVRRGKHTPRFRLLSERQQMR